MTARPPEKMDGGSTTYRGRKIALLTQHGKERVITPVLEAHLGCHVVHVSGYDTDRLGTFTREIPRAGTQLEAARTKARIGMELSGLSIGLASEGSFGPDPITGMLPWNVELLIWIDETLGIEVVGCASGKTNFSHRLTASWEEAKQFARDAGFPGHWLVMRPEGEEHPEIRKGITSWDELEKAFHWACVRATNGCAFLETDMRAHANPTRMETIASAARDLAQKLCSYCPACGAPGFHAAERLAGLPCEDCGAPTRETRAEIHRCARCGHQLIAEKNEAKRASAARCDYCNP
jgi:DNA-directed RNA polymerase subunit RPC12/RpoP